MKHTFEQLRDAIIIALVGFAAAVAFINGWNAGS